MKPADPPPSARRVGLPSAVCADLDALATSTLSDLPTLEDTARALEAARARRTERTEGVPMRTTRQKILVLTGGLAAAALVTLCPVPYMHAAGWDVTLRAPDGHVAKVRVHARSAEDAQRLASAISGRGAAFEGTAIATRHTELVWRSMYALAMEKILHIDVDMTGKSDAEVAAEIRAQVEQQGWAPGNVVVSHEGGTSVVDIGASDGDGRELRILRHADDGKEQLKMEVGGIDDAREPGMTDEQLRAKIVGQFRARGMDAEVTFVDGHVEVRAHKRGEHAGAGDVTP